MSTLLESVYAATQTFVRQNPYAVPISKLLFAMTDAYPGPLPERDEMKTELEFKSVDHIKDSAQRMTKLVHWCIIPSMFVPSILPWIFTVHRMHKMETPKFEIRDKREWIGLAVSFIGIAIRISSRLWLGREFTYTLTVRKGHKLTTSGPYAIVRHPGYTGYVLWYLGDALYYHATWRYLYTMFLLWMAMRKMPLEEKVLADAFGDEYKEYQRKTPYRLIPFVY